MGSATTFMLMAGLAASVVMIRRRQGELLVVAPEGIPVEDVARLVRAACTPDEVQRLRDLTGDLPAVAEAPQLIASAFRDRALSPDIWVDADGICRKRCTAHPAA